MKNEKKIVRLNFENGFNFSLLKSRELIEENEIIVDGKKRIKRKFKVYYDKNKTLKMFKSKILLLKKWSVKIVVFGEVDEKLNIIDCFNWDYNVFEMFLGDKKIVKNENEELVEFNNRFDWLEDLMVNNRYEKIKIIPGN